MKDITIIGAGPGHPKYLSTQALSLISNASCILAFNRLKHNYDTLNDNIIEVNMHNIVEEINKSDDDIIIIVSGDINFYSIKHYLNQELAYNFKYICGFNSLQVLSEKINLSYQDVKSISLHGLNKHYLGSVAANQYTFLLLDSTNNVVKILNDLKEYPHLKYYIGENLSLKNERISIGSYQELFNNEYSKLSVVLIENIYAYNPFQALYDEAFIRNETPMTKQEIRWNIKNLLDLKSNDILYDIGAGSGSVGIEASTSLPLGLVYAIEHKENAFALIKANIKQFNAYNVLPILSEASLILEELPICSKAFIGGSNKNLKNIINKLYQINHKVVIVISAITLETLSESIIILKELAIDYDVTCLNVASSHKVGSYNMMYAKNPIYLIKTKELN